MDPLWASPRPNWFGAALYDKGKKVSRPYNYYNNWQTQNNPINIKIQIWFSHKIITSLKFYRMIFEDTNESYLSNKHSNKVQLWYFLLYYDLIIFVMFFFYISRPKKIYNYPLSHGLDCLGYENFFSWQFGAWIFNIRRQKLESIVGEVIFILSTIKNILKEKKCSIQKVYIHKKTEIKSTTIFFILLITRIFQWKNNFKKKKKHNVAFYVFVAKHIYVK